MLEGKNVNLRVMEKEDIPLVTEWLNSLTFQGEYFPLLQMPRLETEKMFDGPYEWRNFIIEKKDGSKIGHISHFYDLNLSGRLLEMGFALVPSERGKGYCTEAAKIMVDYLFLSKDTMRIQAITDAKNVPSHKVLEKVGFKKEGTIRKSFFLRGEFRDCYLYSVLREEWKEPKILTKS